MPKRTPGLNFTSLFCVTGPKNSSKSAFGVMFPPASPLTYQRPLWACTVALEKRVKPVQAIEKNRNLKVRFINSPFCVVTGGITNGRNRGFALSCQLLVSRKRRRLRNRRSLLQLCPDLRQDFVIPPGGRGVRLLVVVRLQNQIPRGQQGFFHLWILQDLFLGGLDNQAIMLARHWPSVLHTLPLEGDPRDTHFFHVCLRERPGSLGFK